MPGAECSQWVVNEDKKPIIKGGYMKIEFKISDDDFSRLQRFGAMQPGMPSPAEVVKTMVAEFLATPGAMTAKEMTVEALKKQAAAETKLRDTQERVWATEARLAKAEDEVQVLTRQNENLKKHVETLKKNAGLLTEHEAQQRERMLSGQWNI
jgi:predicted  nucleic acid-binding Zn-ribbon protein